MPRMSRSVCVSFDETTNLPDASNEISPASNNASRLATRGSPLLGSKRSLLVESHQGLMCDALIATAVVAPVTAQVCPQNCRTSERNLPCPSRAFMRASLVVDSIFCFASVSISPTKVRWVDPSWTSSTTGTWLMIRALLLHLFLLGHPIAAKRFSQTPHSLRGLSRH